MTLEKRPIRVLVVDDSAVVARVLVDVLTTDPDIEVVGVAGDGLEAVALTEKLKPDLITMDVRMPKMDGLQATRKIMEEHPTPIIIVSASVNVQDMNITFEALRAGALDIIEKPRGVGHRDYEEVRGRLIRAVKTMSEVKLVRRWPESKMRRSSRLPRAVLKKQEGGRVVLIGCSTGGPAALEAILSRLPQSFPAPVLVVQHIAPGFIGGLVEWLDGSSAMKVKIAETGEHPLAGSAYLAPDGYHIIVSDDGSLILDDGPPYLGHKPSINKLFQSAARVWGNRAIAVVLTGMGSDGTEGMRELKKAGATCLAQDEKSAVVYGMPKEVTEAGLVDKVVALGDLAAEIAKSTS